MLQTHGIPLPGLEASMLVAHVLGCSRTWIAGHPEKSLSARDGLEYLALVVRRCRREPAAYITGVKDWLDFTLHVNRNVLIPRPETELLAEVAIQLLDCRVGFGSEPLTVVDVGTGSGALAVAIARTAIPCDIFAIDTSAGALRTAERNAERLAPGRVRCLQTDLLAHVPGPYSMIVANLPYVPSGEIASLEPELHYEPANALDGGAAGLDIISRLIGESARTLTRGWIVLECGFGQSEAVRITAQSAWPEARVIVHPDLAGIDRVIAIHVGPDG